MQSTQTTHPAEPVNGWPALSPEQQKTQDRIGNFIQDQKLREFLVCGTAGTGKTTLGGEVVRRYRNVRLIAPTGGAALQLQQRSGRAASTVHRALYVYDGTVKDERTGKPKPVFRRQRKGALQGTIFLLDEGSMVSAEMRQDLLDSGARLIVLCDPAQLPPVWGEPAFIGPHIEPDAVLREVHRQALDSAIIFQAQQVLRRGGHYSPQGDGPDFRVFHGELPDQELLAADAIICWRNDTRHHINRRVRALRRHTSPLPEPGETLLCQRNAPEIGLYNGGTYRLCSYIPGLRFMILDIDGVPTEVENALFTEEDYPDRHGVIPFDFGYALTAHKAQGSEWRNVLIVDEKPSSYDDYVPWIYTAITRASKSCTICVMK